MNELIFAIIALQNRSFSTSCEIMAESNSKEPEDASEFRQWLQANKGRKIRIMVSGRTGAGKSTLLNVVFGTNFFIGHQLDAGTKKVTLKHAEKEDIHLELFDCPGLEDATASDKDYLEDISANCESIDLAIFCISMMAPRSNLRNDASALSNITKVLGPEIWKSTVVCLTFSNMLEKRIKTRNRQASVFEIKNEFDKKIQEWCRHLRSALEQNQVPTDVIDKVIKTQVCVGGHMKYLSLPGVEDWITEVWVKCIQAMPEDSRALAIQAEMNNIINGEDPEVQEYKKRGLTDPSKRKLLLSPKTLEILGLTAASGTAVAVGATTGAIIGTFTIGLPSFGVAAGAGTAIGGAIGAGVGCTVGILYGIFKRIKTKRTLTALANS